MSTFSDKLDSIKQDFHQFTVQEKKTDKKSQVAHLKELSSLSKDHILKLKDLGKTFTKVRAKPGFRPIIKKLEFCSNYLESTIDVLRDEYDTKDYDEAITKANGIYVRELSSLILDLERSVSPEDINSSVGSSNMSNESKSVGVQKAALGPKGFRSMFDAFPENVKETERDVKEAQRKEERLETYIKQNAQVLTRYNSYRNFMPKSTDKNRTHIVMRMPIIPLTDPPIQASAYLSAGYEAENMGLYPIVEDQLIIGINKNAKQSVTVQEVLDAINSKSAQKWVLVTEKAIGYKNVPFSFYWATKERSLNRLYTSGGKFKIRQWGWAFQ